MASRKRGGSDSLPLPSAKKSLPGTDVQPPVEQHQEQTSWKDVVADGMLTDPFVQSALPLFCQSNDEDGKRYFAIAIVHKIITKSQGQLDLTYNKIATAIMKDDMFRSLVYKAIPDQNWHSIMDSPILQRPVTTNRELEPPELKDEDKQAVTRAWSAEYTGGMAAALRRTVVGYLKPQNKSYYARFTSFAQSSGTGKSRMIDELAKTTLVIPVCFASQRSHQCYPPSDTRARKWADDTLSDAQTQSEAFTSVKAFLQALFETTQQRLQEIETDILSEDPDNRTVKLANGFRTRMTEGMAFSGHNTYRTNFYVDVIKRTEEITGDGQPETTPSSTTSSNQQEGVLCAADQLVEKFKTIGHLAADSPIEPIVIAFDESHILASTHSEQGWSLFSELRRALQIIIGLPIFSIFLSTSGKIHLFSPDPSIEQSNRLRSGMLRLYQPIVETPFDLFVQEKKYSTKLQWKLQYVASTEHMLRFGRPLFYAMYAKMQNRNRQGLLEFARQKLLFSTLDSPQKAEEDLACLAIRLGLEFQATSWLHQDTERRQVEQHMRICLFAAAGFQNFVTVSPSEPFLAEAAYSAMANKSDASWPSILLSHMDKSHLDKGTRGEIAAALILLMARDKAVDITESEKTDYPLDYDGVSSGRVVTVTRFLDELIGKSESLSSWSHMYPYAFRKGERKRMQEVFEGCNIYFNHFIKANAFELVSREFLTLAIFRGAAIICADNQAGIDIILPYIKGNVLKKDAVGAILIQVKNNVSFTTTLCGSLFDKMEPFDRGVYSNSDKATLLPVIRMVFALASDEDSVVYRGRPNNDELSTEPESKFTAYDIWFAGVGSFMSLPDSDLSSAYHLIRLPEVNDLDLLYSRSKPSLPHRLEAVRGLYPYSTTHPGHFDNWVEMDGDLGDRMKKVNKEVQARKDRQKVRVRRAQ